MVLRLTDEFVPRALGWFRWSRHGIRRKNYGRPSLRPLYPHGRVHRDLTAGGAGARLVAGDDLAVAAPQGPACESRSLLSHRAARVGSSLQLGTWDQRRSEDDG